MVNIDQAKGSEQLPSLIVLTGFRATGKSAVGNYMAALIGYMFVDTDQLISSRLGCSIGQSVKRHGWQPFREMEQTVLREIADCRQTVIATGGGAILHHREWQQLHTRAHVVWLRADITTTLTRLDRDSNTAEQRPDLPGTGAAADRETVTAALLAERASLYRAGSDVVIETDRRSPQKIAALLLASFLKPDIRRNK
jgi:shikimate kinase